MKTHLLLGLFALSSSAAAQIVYEAGEAGDPPQAPSPTTQGWKELVAGPCTVQDVSPDPDYPINAWELRDSGPGRIEYSDQLESKDPYECELVMRPLAGTIWIDLVAGTLLTDNPFIIELRLIGEDVHVHVYGNGVLVGVCADAACRRILPARP